MGSGEVDHFPIGKAGEEETPADFGEICERLCPDYLAMGMTLDEYWNGDAELVTYVRKAHKLKREHENEAAWLQGQYIYEALLCASPMFHDWVKHPRPIPYPSEPYKLFEEKPTQTDEDKKELHNQATIRAWVERVNRRKGEKQNGR